MTDQNQTPDPQNALPNDDGGRVADATDLNWVDRFCPLWSRPYLRLSRADRPAGTWLLLIPCWWGLMLAVVMDPNGLQPMDGWIAISCAIGAFLMRGAGCTWNDITDRHIDAQVERTRSRPLPSGQVTTKQALAWMIIQALLAACILFSFNWFTVALGIAALLPVAVYPFAKRFTWWPQVFLGIAFNWGALLAWAAHAGSLSLTPVLLYLAGIAWTLFYDTIYAHQDIEDDALIGVKSTARLFADNTPRWLFIFQVIAMSLMLLSIFTPTAVAQLLANPAVFLLVFIGIWGFGAHLTLQLRKLDINDPQNCMHLFRSNREAGLIPVVFWALAILIG
jgi:4-hydroxybenzoate polyprenyltransferase